MYKAKNQFKNQKRQQITKKEQKIVYKGIFISNQRRKGHGGRIKSQSFNCKIQINQFNPALHQSQVQWVQIKRYKKAEKSNKNKKIMQKQKLSFKINQNINMNNKQFKLKEKSQINKIQNQSTNSINQQIQQPQIKIIEKKQKQQTIDNRIQKNIQQEIKDIRQDRHNEEEQTQNQSQNQQQVIEQIKQIQIIQRQTIKLIKNQQNEIRKQTVNNQDNKQKQQQIIVARIIKETKIVYKQKKFVGIMTCQKKKNIKNNFIEKNAKPIEKILQDYYLDVTPIHSRLAKMQFDDYDKQNIKILSNYIQKMYPQKGKQLTFKKLNQILDVIQSIYVVASFNGWQKDMPFAKIHQVIGKTMTIDGQCNCFLHEHSLNDFQYQENLENKSNVQNKIIQICPTQYHIKFDKMVFSIDPASSVDLDDALSIEKIQQSTFQIGIHISDVSQYLKYIDRKELMKRTTSVYLPHKCYHMLTQDLMKISSLNPNVQRLAFSIYVKMNMQGQIIGQSRIQKNIVKSRFKLSYQTVQDIISGKINYEGFLIKHPQTQIQQFVILVEKLQNLTFIGLAHRQKRIKFQVFQNREISFQLDKDKWPIQISVESRYTSKKIVQQYMIIGNVQAAKHLIKNFQENSLIIYHPKPSELSIRNFNQTFKFLDIKFEFQDILKIQENFLEISKDQNISQEIKQYLYFKGRRMQQTAGYKLYNEAIKEIKEKNKQKQDFIAKNVHFALGEQFYTHFTSPMRRMADILVHQTLNSLIYKKEPNPILGQQIEKINDGRKHTKRLKKDITEIYMCLMIYKNKKLIKQDGIVTSFGLKSISIYIPYFDMMKELMWKDQLQVNKVSKNRQNQDQLDVCIYYDKKYPSRDIYWNVKKYQKVKLVIDCTKRPPLRLSIELQVISTKGKPQKIYAHNPEF